MTFLLQQQHKLIIAIQFLSAIILILFWIGYFLLPVVYSSPPSFYTDFADALPLPDGLLALLLVCGGVLLTKGVKFGVLITGLSAFGMIFLGILGFHIELKGGAALVSMVSMLKSGFVNLWCVVFGLYFLLKLKGRKQQKSVR